MPVAAESDEARVTEAAPAPSRAHALVSPWWRSTTAGAMALFLGFGLLASIYLLARMLALLALGVAIAESLAHLANRMQRRLPRTLSIIILYLLVLALVVGMGWLTFPTLVDQAQQLGTRLPDLVKQVETFLERYGILGSNTSLVQLITSHLGSIGSALASLPTAIISSIADGLLVLVISVYWLVLTPPLWNFTMSLFPEKSQPNAANLFRRMGSAMGGYVRGTVIDGFAIGVATYFGLLLIGVNFPLVLAIIAGVFEMIPVIGPVISAIPILFIALLESPTKALIALAFVILLQQAENHLLVPNVMRTQTHTSPLLTILALFVGGTLAGLLGALVAIPLVAAGRIFVLEVIAPAVRRWTGAAGPKVETP